MALTRFGIRNYKAFLHEALIELRPLTLLFGYNSAGKSALLRALPLLSDSVGGELSRPLNLDSPPARGARFADLRSRFGDDPSIDFILHWALPTGVDQSARYVVRELEELRVQVIECLEVEQRSAGKEKISLRAQWSATVEDGCVVPTYSIITERGPLDDQRVLFQGLTHQLPSDHPMSIFRPALESLRSDVHWLGSLRATPPRSIEFRQRSRKVGEDGSGAWQILAHDDAASGQLVRLASEWFAKIAGSTLHILAHRAARADQFSLELAPLEAPGVKIPIADTGEGMAQVLPLVTLCCMAQAGHLGSEPTLALEHPELHLHPRAHAGLARLLCDTARMADLGSVIVETHSRHLLLRVQLEVAKGRIPPEDVAIYWVRATENGPAVVDQINVDENGVAIGWPPDVFGEDLKLATDLVTLRGEAGR